LDKMLDFTVELFDIKDLWVAIDGTGHSNDQASLYYSGKNQKTTQKMEKKLHQKPNSNRHINTSHNSSQSSKRT